MNKRRIGIFLLSFIMIFISSMTSFGEIKINTDMKNGKVIVTGHSDYKDQPATIQIHDKKKKVYFDQKNTDAEGNFTFQSLLDDNEEYNGYVLIEGEKEIFSFKTDKKEKPVEKITNEEKIKKALSNIKKDYELKDTFGFKVALGYYHGSDNKKEAIKVIQEKYKEETECSYATDYAGNIIGMITKGINPYKYQNGKYINTLVDAQKPSGIFEISKEGEQSTQTAWSMIALDMAKAKYNIENAIKALMKMQDEKGSFGSIDHTAMCIMALQNHKEIEGALESIQKAKEYLFIQKKSIIEKGNVPTIATVIQGLVSIGENPLAKEWMVEDQNMLTALLKREKKGYFGSKTATEQAFMALADLYQKESMYTKVNIDGDGFDNEFEGGENETKPEEGNLIPTKPEEQKVYISIRGYENNPNIRGREVKIEKDDTVLDVTLKVLKAENITYELNAPEDYFIRIGKYGEFDKGGKSGWEYKVNGKKLEDLSVIDYEVKPLDEIEWEYTTDYTKDSNYQKPKDEIQKEIESINNILGGSIKEEDIKKSLENITNQFNKKAEDIKTQDDAKDIVSYGEDFSKVLEKAIDKVKTEEGSKDLFKESIKVIEILSKSAEKLNKEEDQIKVSQVTTKNIENTIKIVEKIDDSKQIVNLTKELIHASGKVINTISKENAKEVIESTINIGQKAIEKSSTKEIHDVKVEKEKAVIVVDEKTIKETAKNTFEVTKDIKEQLNKNKIEFENIENKVMLQISNAKQKEIEVKLPVNTMSIIKENSIEKIIVKTQNVVFTITPNTLDKVNDSITLSAKEIERNTLNHQVPKESIVVDLNVKVGENFVKEFKENMKIAIPYNGEVKEQDIIKAFYLKEDETIENMGGEYDPTTQLVTFEASHFSKYFAKKVEKEEIKVTFNDLADYEWAKEAIEEMANKGIIKERSEGVFDPGASITRAEFATLITKMLGFKIEDINISFIDVEDSDWYTPYVKTAYKNGLISGRSVTIFDPNGNITREEMATIIGKVLIQKGKEKANINELERFNDKTNIASWANENVALCVKENIISGMPDHAFMPKENANRAQAAFMLDKLYKSIE